MGGYQLSSVFKVPGKKDLYIAIADRWVPDHLEYDYEEYKREYENKFSEEGNGFWNMERFGEDSTRNTSISDYVWLPIRFDGEMAYIDWRDEWKIEEYD